MCVFVRRLWRMVCTHSTSRVRARCLSLVVGAEFIMFFGGNRLLARGGALRLIKRPAHHVSRNMNIHFWTKRYHWDGFHRLLLSLVKLRRRANQHSHYRYPRPRQCLLIPGLRTRAIGEIKQTPYQASHLTCSGTLSTTRCHGG